MWDDIREAWQARYDPWCCIRGCYNDICVLTGRRLDGKKGNVFYDVKVTRIRHDGSIWDGEKMISITKGAKMFDSSKPLPICEAYAKQCKNRIIDREKSKFHRELYLNKDTTVEVLNVRAEIRESRDLLQDLQDVREGIKITHASDELKLSKRVKSDRRKIAKERTMKKRLKLWIVTGEEQYSRYLLRRGMSEEELEEARQAPVQVKEKENIWRAKTESRGSEQLSLF
jgi:hypothetical protein